MMPVSLDLPVRAGEASQLADLIFQFAEGRKVDAALRRMLESRATQTPWESMKVLWGSLCADPNANSTYYVAVDGRTPALLHIALSSAPASGLFPGPVLIGRMRTPRGLEVVVNAIPFTASNAEHVLTFATQVDRSLLPGPQGVETLYIAANADPDTAFAQFRAIQRKYGLSVAAYSGPAYEALYGAIRHGWREGFALSGEDELRSRTTIDATAMSDEALDDRIDAARRAYGRAFDIDVRFDAPGSFTKPAVLGERLARLRENGRPVQVAFVEIGLDAARPYPERWEQMAGWPEDIVSNVQWKAAGKTLQELRQRVEDLQVAARQHGAVIGVRGYGSLTEPVLEAIGSGANRRLWFELGDGLSSDRILELAGPLR
ncbi:MAG: hypothetical protein FJW30_18160 [Acidobacteria bacterium]|nr:hypothetical protein [Acidobacteriota bacterium]